MAKLTDTQKDEGNGSFVNFVIRKSICTDPWGRLVDCTSFNLLLEKKSDECYTTLWYLRPKVPVIITADLTSNISADHTSNISADHTSDIYRRPYQ